MKVSFGKRFASYVIDFIIITVILNLVSFVIPENKNLTNLNNELTELTNEYAEKDIHTEEEIENYMEASAPLTYRIDKENFLFSVVGIIIYILYYVVFQYKNNGQTLGKKIMGIKVVKEDSEISINDFIYRSFIINSILFNMIILILLFITKDVTYITLVGVLGIIQFIIIAVSVCMILFRKDKKSLHDIITNTKVVEVA
ncbi:MAG: RDD family protein [Firmicutes bacterium]|nr:RDD family protein [Bacillota bacterium]